MRRPRRGADAPGRLRRDASAVPTCPGLAILGGIGNLELSILSADELSRLPEFAIVVRSGRFEEQVPGLPQADLGIFGLVASPDFSRLRRLVALSSWTCLFVRDSGHESVLA